MIGARVIKTSLAVILSILTARILELSTPHFAGIIAVLAVQPSIYRSLRYGMQHTISAMMGAVCGAYALYLAGNSFLIMGVVTFLLMTLHVKIKWTNSLLVSVVIAINTMGTTSLFFGESALNQFALVVIGTGFGMLVNLFHKPVHHSRAKTLISQSEGMLRALLFYVYIELLDNRVTPYPAMREQIDQVRAYIEKGKEVSGLMNEDKRFRQFPSKNTLRIFQSFETMVERIRDMSKELQKIDVCHIEFNALKKAVRLTVDTQERVMQGKPVHNELLANVLEKRRNSMWDHQAASQDFVPKLAFYNFYGYLKEYLREMVTLQEKTDYS